MRTRTYNAILKMNVFARKFLALIVLSVAGCLSLAAVFVGGYYYVEPTLPDAADLRNIEIQIPLSVYTRDGRLIAQFGEQKRNPVDYEEIPELVVRAFLAAEDDTFFEHPGIDFTGIARSAFNYLISPSDRVPGASTITQSTSCRGTIRWSASSASRSWRFESNVNSQRKKFWSSSSIRRFWASAPTALRLRHELISTRTFRN